MSQNLENNKEFSPNGHAGVDSRPVNIGLRLRAVDQSDRSIVSNITGVHLGSGFAFIDFGFIEQSALTEVTRAARSGEQKNPTLDGRLECRIAMSIGDLSQLARQIEQVIVAASKAQAIASTSQQNPLGTDSISSLQ